MLYEQFYINFKIYYLYKHFGILYKKQKKVLSNSPKFKLS